MDKASSQGPSHYLLPKTGGPHQPGTDKPCSPKAWWTRHSFFPFRNGPSGEFWSLKRSQTCFISENRGFLFFFFSFLVFSFSVKNGWWKSAVLPSQPMDTKASDRWLERPRCPAKGLLPWRIGGFRGRHKLLRNTWNKAREGEKDGFNILPKLLPSYRACLHNLKNNSGVMHWFIRRRTTAPNLSVPVWHLRVFFALVKYLLVFVNPHHFHCFWTLPRSWAAAEDFISHPHLRSPGPPPPAARSISGFVKAAMPLETQRVSPGCSQEQRRDIYTDIKYIQRRSHKQRWFQRG